MDRPLRPPAAPERPVIRVVQPSGAVDEHRAAIEAGAAALERHGCRVRWDRGRAGACWRGYLAGTDDDRAQELIAALTEPEVDIVWWARGGSGAARIAERVVEALRGRPPRLVVGFSDATAVLNALAAKLGWVTFHGPVVASFGRAEPACDPSAVFEVLRGRRSTIEFEPSTGPRLEGTLRGGNLCVLASTAGTRLWPAARDGVWLLEDVNEPRYRLDRLLWQVRAAGLFAGARGVWVGDLGLPPDEEAAGRRLVTEEVDPVPVVFGAPAGHQGRLDALPIGGRIVLDPPSGRLWAASPWVATPGGGHV